MVQMDLACTGADIRVGVGHGWFVGDSGKEQRGQGMVQGSVLGAVVCTASYPLIVPDQPPSSPKTLRRSIGYQLAYWEASCWLAVPPATIVCQHVCMAEDGIESLTSESFPIP